MKSRSGESFFHALWLAALIILCSKPAEAATWRELLWAPVSGEAPFAAGVQGATSSIELDVPYKDQYGFYLDFKYDTSHDRSGLHHSQDLARQYGAWSKSGATEAQQDVKLLLHIDIFRRTGNISNRVTSGDFSKLSFESWGGGDNYLLITNFTIGPGSYRAVITSVSGNTGLSDQLISFVIRVPGHK